ncbi:hypothetical protein TNCV_3923021 [Trichonephila clavipes]|nr:hypothetical protein TNCV_3923021 [Trichonephila clavipes]
MVVPHPEYEFEGAIDLYVYWTDTTKVLASSFPSYFLMSMLTLLQSARIFMLRYMATPPTLDDDDIATHDIRSADRRLRFVSLSYQFFRWTAGWGFTIADLYIPGSWYLFLVRQIHISGYQMTGGNFAPASSRERET